MTTLTVKEKLERTQNAAMLALEFLQESPPRIVLARGALKAALDPESPRWGDSPPPPPPPKPARPTYVEKDPNE